MYNDLSGKTYDIRCMHVLKGQSVWLSYCRTLFISRQEALQWEGLCCTASASLIKIICGEMWACTHIHRHTQMPSGIKANHVWFSGGNRKYKLAHAILAHIMSQAAVMHRLLDLSSGGSTCGSGERGWEEVGPARNVL